MHYVLDDTLPVGRSSSSINRPTHTLDGESRIGRMMRTPPDAPPLRHGRTAFISVAWSRTKCDSGFAPRTLDADDRNDHSCPAGGKVLRAAERKPHPGHRPHRSGDRPGRDRRASRTLGLREIHAVSMLTGLCVLPPARSSGTKSHYRCRPNVAIVFQSFALFPGSPYWKMSKRR